jgi:hypothetical protein
VNNRSEPALDLLSVVETATSPHLHLVRDHPADETLCGSDARLSTVVRRTEASCCPRCVTDALAGGHLVALTAAHAYVNLRRLSVAGPEEAS